MLKRFSDIIISAFTLVLFFPVLIIFSILIFFQDFKNPFYIAPRVGKDSKSFNMIKLRSMIVDADKSGVDSTASNDLRITAIGRLVRKYKLDELTQLINVLKGDMSLVGPRPNVYSETRLYSQEEKVLLSVRPGITDFASIVFSDEGEILKDSEDPDLQYNQLIRPGKNYLGLFYIKKSNQLVDISLCFFTVIAIISKPQALSLVNILLKKLDANEKLIEIALRDKPLKPIAPPGLDDIIRSR
jgi:lipopolysaccharide/colanic/teichoic acid biosynthesis glycosyltransferase